MSFLLLILKDGVCVRQYSGAFTDPFLLNQDPVDIAGEWFRSGCRRLHLVDFNGAFSGRSINIDAVARIARAYPEIPLQVSGGVQSLATVEAYIEAGASWVVIGTKELLKPGFAGDACKQFSGHIIAGIDARNGQVATHAWAKTSDITVFQFALQLEQEGVTAIVYTDMSRNSLMQRINIDATMQLASNITIPVIASGGISNMDDIRELKSVAHHGLEGVITGRAIYERTLDLNEAQRFCDE